MCVCVCMYTYTDNIEIKDRETTCLIIVFVCVRFLENVKSFTTKATNSSGIFGILHLRDLTMI